MVKNPPTCPPRQSALVSMVACASIETAALPGLTFWAQAPNLCGPRPEGPVAQRYQCDRCSLADRVMCTAGA